MKNYFKKLALLFTVALVLIVSCSKDDTQNEPINQDGGEIFRSQVVTIVLSGVTLNDTEYQGTIDGVAIRLSKAANDKLTFMVPYSTALGLKDLVIPTLNNAVIRYDIKETILTQTVTETLSPFFANLVTFSQNSDGSPEAIEAQATLDSFNNFYANATDSEKTEIAIIYKANKSLFDSIILDTYAGRNIADANADCLAIAVLGMGASVALMISPTGVGQILGVGLFAVSLVKAKKCGKPLYSEFVMAENIRVNDFTGDNNRLASASLIFQNDITTSVTFNILKRKLIASDSNKTQPIWVSFFSSFNLMNAHVVAVNAVISVLNNSPFVNFAPLTKVQLPSTSTNLAVAANQIIFSDIQFTVSHPNLQLVSATLQGTGQMNIKIKFIGTPSVVPVVSFLNYSYSDDFNNFSGKLPIQVEAVSPDEVVIGSQVWKTKNLDVATYRNGDPIPQVTDATQWENLTTGAWCYYENNTANGPVYGKLYNWYAVNDPRGLAPTGYHVPSDGEWANLINFLGGVDFAGGKMKETGTMHWISPNIGATNSSGFIGIPGGFRDFYSSFVSIGNIGKWWSSSEYYASSAWHLDLSYDNGSTYIANSVKRSGHSVRCLKD